MIENSDVFFALDVVFGIFEEIAGFFVVLVFCSDFGSEMVMVGVVIIGDGVWWLRWGIYGLVFGFCFIFRIY